jgi:hypothetical protein
MIRGHDKDRSIHAWGLEIVGWRSWLVIMKSFGKEHSYMEALMQTLQWEHFAERENKTCKSDVRVLLHCRSMNCLFSSRETRFCDADEVRVLLQRKKNSKAAIRVQQKRGGVNVWHDNELRSKRASECCTRVAMRRQSVCEVVRFSRA